MNGLKFEKMVASWLALLSHDPELEGSTPATSSFIFHRRLLITKCMPAENYGDNKIRLCLKEVIRPH